MEYQSPISPLSYPIKGLSNQFLVVSLFIEPWSLQHEASKAEGVTPVFSLNDKEGYISARQTFLAEKDPTGVKWSQKWLGGVPHLNRLLQAGWFRDQYDNWVKELEQILESEALEKIRSIADSNGQGAFQAAKFLATKEWKRHGRGRPSKAEVAAEAKKEAEAHFGVSEDMQRILKVVK